MKVHHPSPSSGHHGGGGGYGGPGAAHPYGPLSHHQLAAAAAAAGHHDPLSAAAVAASSPHHVPPGPPGPPSGYPQLMDMYSAAAAAGMSPTTAINTMDWKNTSQVRKEKQFGGRRVFLTDGVACEIANSCMNGVPSFSSLCLPSVFRTF